MTGLIIIVVILLHAAVLVPIFLASRPGQLGNAMLALCPLLALFVVVPQFGFIGGSRPPAITLGIDDEGEISETACRQVRDRLKQAKLLLDDSDPNKVVVNGATWRQIPEQVRSAVSECFEQLAPGDGPVTIVESPAG